jgi:GNAT superfamily N-acetyltransferase
MIVRRYRKGEEAQIKAIYHNTIHKVNIRDYSQAQVDAWAPDYFTLQDCIKRLEQKNPFVAVESEQILGYGELDKDGHIDCFYCHHEWQGKGVGKAIYNAIEEEARRMGIKRLFAEASITAKGFFEKMGFITEKEQKVAIRGQDLTNFIVSKSLEP